MKMYTTNKDFNYEQPQMLYDKATGDVKILKKEKGPTKKIIRSVDDYEREKALLMKEIGMSSTSDLSNLENEKSQSELDEHAAKALQLHQ